MENYNVNYSSFQYLVGECLRRNWGGYLSHCRVPASRDYLHGTPCGFTDFNSWDSWHSVSHAQFSQAAAVLLPQALKKRG
jgi:hypothetical protein